MKVLDRDTNIHGQRLDTTKYSSLDHYNLLLGMLKPFQESVRVVLQEHLKVKIGYNCVIYPVYSSVFVGI